MRESLCLALLQKAKEKDFIFLTGDLGFMALESLRDAMGNRFINAGLAEQNMVSVAAGMAKIGLDPWVYSIGPFLYARPFEQIRNDVCMHDLPVRLVGNGGGYAYGVMGATHHALEDYGTLLCLPNMHVFIPAFSEDVFEIVHRCKSLPHPAYVRLGRNEKPAEFVLPEYMPWRRLIESDGATMVAVGPIVGSILEKCETAKKQPDLWVLTEMPLKTEEIPDLFFDSLHRSKHLIVVEEHGVFGSVGQALVHLLCSMGRAPAKFTHRFAQGYLSGTYGSQKFHRLECGLDAESILKIL